MTTDPYTGIRYRPGGGKPLSIVKIGGPTPTPSAFPESAEVIAAQPTASS